MTDVKGSNGEHEKIFRDSVHGYVHVPDTWCKLFIDTPIFQRLRWIEQTSMRCLYPSARHDRFVHSIGVYHLGRRAIDHLIENSSGLLQELNIGEEVIEEAKNTFKVACLLHDCAHSPFSHTLEDYYKKAQNLHEMLCDTVNDDNIESDLKYSDASSHELASAIVLLKHFQTEEHRKDINWDPNLAARMITGCTYTDSAEGDLKQFKNVLISLLNGKSIDVDKLDYIVRDTWASGFSNVNVDVDRLLSAISIIEIDDRLKLAFKPTALSVIRSVIDARNLLHRWIYTHHKVVYSQHLLVKAVEGVIHSLDPRQKLDKNIAKLFSLDTFDPESKVKIGKYEFSLLSDVDLIHLMQQFKDIVPEANEWLSRTYGRKAVWKSRAEFKSHFGHWSIDEQKRLRKRALDRVSPGFDDDKYICLDAKSKEIGIAPNEVYINVGSGCEPVPYIVKSEEDNDNEVGGVFFYVYKNNKDEDSTRKIVDNIKKNGV